MAVPTSRAGVGPRCSGRGPLHVVVCIFVYVYTCIHSYSYIHIYICTHGYIFYKHLYLYMCMSKYIYIYIYIHMYIWGFSSLWLHFVTRKLPFALARSCTRTVLNTCPPSSLDNTPLTLPHRPCTRPCARLYACSCAVLVLEQVLNLHQNVKVHC